MNWKSLEAWRDWVALSAGDYSIIQVVLYADHICQHKFEKHITITHIFRTDERQRELYEEYNKPYKPSVHSHWRGVDIRSSTLTDDECNVLVQLINNRFTYGNGKDCAIYHDIGAGSHIHLQVPTKKGPWHG